ncbi:hypothetical protein FKP32DRAFT_1673504 [Trametes sanguinea]|nr:hypothetical protein FKP32DRAFT_1673504 [Trametes sanguinea]
MLSLESPVRAQVGTTTSDPADQTGTPTDNAPPAAIQSLSPCVVSCGQQWVPFSDCILGSAAGGSTIDFDCYCALNLNLAGWQTVVSCVKNTCGARDYFNLALLDGGCPDSLIGPNSSITSATSRTTHTSTAPTFSGTSSGRAPSTPAEPSGVPPRSPSDSSSHASTALTAQSSSLAVGSTLDFSASAIPPMLSSPSGVPVPVGSQTTSLSNSTPFGTVSSSGQSSPATTTVVLNTTVSSPHSGLSRILVIALVTPLGAVVLIALMLAWLLFLRRRRRKDRGSSRFSAHPAPTTDTLEDVASTGEVREPPVGICDPAVHALPSTTISGSSGDDHLISSPPDPHSEPSAMQTTTPAISLIPARSTDNTVSSVSDPVESVAQRAEPATVSLMPEPATVSPPDVPALAPPEHVEDEKAPTSLVDASNPDGMRQVRPHTEQQDTPSPTAAREAFDRAVRREDYGLFDTEIADDEDPPPYEPRAQDL